MHSKCGNCCSLQFYHMHRSFTLHMHRKLEMTALNALRLCSCFVHRDMYRVCVFVCKFPFALPADIIIHVCLCFKSAKICSTFRQFFTHTSYICYSEKNVEIEVNMQKRVRDFHTGKCVHLLLAKQQRQKESMVGRCKTSVYVHPCVCTMPSYMCF